MALTNEINWTFAATSAASSDACMRAETWAREAGLPDMLIMRLVLVIEELFTNTIKHGYRRESKRPVKIALGVQGRSAVLDYRDRGPPFDSVRTMEICAEQNAPLRVGGLGLFLIQSISGKAVYANEERWNIVRLEISDGPLPKPVPGRARRH